MTDSSEVADSLSDWSWTAPDNSFVKLTKTQGEGTSAPTECCKCSIRISVKEGSTYNYERAKVNLPAAEGTYIIGENDGSLDSAIDKCLRTMKPGEVCELQCFIPKSEISEETSAPPSMLNSPSSDLGSLKSDVSTPDIQSLKSEISGLDIPPENGVVEIYLDLELVGFDSSPEPFELDVAVKLDRAKGHKSRGVELYAQGKLMWAYHRFTKAGKYLVPIQKDLLSEGDRRRYVELYRSTYLNMAACQLASKQYENVIKSCEKAMEVDPDNLKAFYRRGVAYMGLQEYEKAADDLKEVLLMEPSNTSALKQMQILEGKMKDLDRYYANAMKKMFS